MWLTTSVTNHFSDLFILFQFSLCTASTYTSLSQWGLGMIISEVVALKGDRWIRLLGDEVPRRLLLEQLIALVSFVFQNVKNVVTAERSVILVFTPMSGQHPDDFSTVFP